MGDIHESCFAGKHRKLLFLLSYYRGSDEAQSLTVKLNGWPGCNKVLTLLFVKFELHAVKVLISTAPIYYWKYNFWRHQQSLHFFLPLTRINITSAQKTPNVSLFAELLTYWISYWISLKVYWKRYSYNSPDVFWTDLFMHECEKSWLFLTYNHAVIFMS